MKAIILLLLSSLACAETIISPNMNLPVPIVSQTTGPEWANDINSCMSAIDSHDHTPGKGVAISSQAININADLPLNNNSLTSAKAVVFSSQSSFPTNQSLYVEAPDLFYNDGNGNIVRITQSGSVSGASGTITGLPSGTASASYQSVGGTFKFQSATNTPANITGASLTISEQVASVTPTGITLKAPSGLAASYNVTFPSSVPSATSLLTMSTSGGLATVPYHVPTVQKFITGSGTYTTPSSPAPMFLKITMVGAGGGGGGSGAGGESDGSGGSSTTFGTAFLSCTGGAAGGNGNNNAPGAGGAGTLNSPAIGISGTGNPGTVGTPTVGTAAVGSGGNGGASILGGGGAGGATISNNGSAGATNSGSGGGGGSSVTAGVNCGNGGGAGGYISALIPSPSASYAYVIGTGGGGGTAGTSGHGGSAGADGQIIVEEYYQ